MIEPLKVGQQIRLISRAVDEKEKSALIIFLATGIHPKCLNYPDTYKFNIGEYSVSWNRTKKKSSANCRLVLSSAMTENLDTIKSKIVGKSRVWLWKLVHDAGDRAKIHINPRRCRHTALCNFVRLDKDIFYIRSATGTSLDTVSDVYTVGIEDKARMTEEEKEWLKWLMEPL